MHWPSKWEVGEGGTFVFTTCHHMPQIGHAALWRPQRTWCPPAQVHYHSWLITKGTQMLTLNPCCLPHCLCLHDKWLFTGPPIPRCIFISQGKQGMHAGDLGRLSWGGFPCWVPQYLSDIGGSGRKTQRRRRRRTKQGRQD